MMRKEMLYADDILTFIRSPETSIPGLLSTIKFFSRFLGSNINWSNREALTLTTYSSKKLFPPGTFRWTDQGIGYLAVLSIIIKVNIETLLEKLD